MIADLAFERPDANGVRRVRFVPRASIPLSAACLVANGLRETLRDIFGESCELSIGEPAGIGRAAWETLAQDAYCFLTRGRQTDVVLVVPSADARTLVGGAFGERATCAAAPLSPLEVVALDRIASRCAGSFEPLHADRATTSHRIAALAVPTCVAFFDVRVRAPVAIEIGIGIVRALPEPVAGAAFQARSLRAVPVDVRVEFAAGTIDARSLLALAPGDVIPLQTQVGAPASLKIADRYVATGTGGSAAGRYSFEVETLHTTGARS